MLECTVCGLPLTGDDYDNHFITCSNIPLCKIHYCNCMPTIRPYKIVKKCFYCGDIICSTCKKILNRKFVCEHCFVSKTFLT